MLEKQLADSVRGTGEEDQQDEPAEYWWNNLGRNSGSYCLIDSGWDVGDTSQGTLQLRYIQDQTVKVEAENGPIHIPAVRAYVEEVRAEDGQVLHQWAGPLPADLADAKNQLEVPWVRSKDTMLARTSARRTAKKAPPRLLMAPAYPATKVRFRSEV
ncbi:hypothetical protein [Mesorhizobium sp. M0674]|uniref:hypothetical protein n=1 Tax=unclassified Mesorhizobium TaxID=325217 RepID=UPI0033361BE8